MLFTEPLSFSSLFLQPLSPLPDLLIASVSLPPTIMTTSSAVFATSRRETMENLLNVPIMEKPNLMELEKDGRRKAGKTEKGRRHAGEAVLRRKLANRAFLVRVERVGKELGTAGGGRAGGRGRGRALSERVAAEFAPSVPYSLNRRSRWAKLSDGDWLSEVAGRGDVPRGGRLRLSLAEADYSLDGSESIRALHSLDAERGLLHSRWGKSGRGAASIGDLISQDGGQQQENRDPRCDEAVDDVLFQLQRPHPVTKVFAAKFFKRTKSFRSAKRCAVDSAFGGTNTSSEQQQQQMEKPRKKSMPMPESEPEEESEFVAQYRPRQETYSLADFVKETCSPPVMVRRQPKGLEVPSTEEEQFAIVPMPECMPLMSRSPSADFADLSPPTPTLFPRDSLQNRLPSALMPHQGTFLRIPLQADIPTLNGLNISKPEWRPIWVDEGTLMFDLSWELSSSRGREPETPLLVMILDGLELILNTVFPLSDTDKLSEVTSSSELGLGLKLDALLKLIKPNFADWITKSELSRAQLISSTFDAHRSVFHSTQLAVASHPIAVYTILEQQRAEWACEEGQFVRAEELMESSKLEQEQNKEDEHDGGIEEEEEEFELIDMTELVREDKESEHEAGNTATNLIDLGPQCADCARCPAPRLAMLRSCGHRFCGECIAKSLEEQIKADGRAELRCPVCSARLPLDLLPRFLPLPVANTFALLHFVRHNSLPPPPSPSVLRPLAQCPGCSGLLLDAGDKLRTHSKIILCSRCSLLWCCHCDSLPHWPLNCAQNVQWTQKFAQHERSQELPEAKNGAISAQFAQIFSEARARRMDLKLGWQLGKCTRRLLGDSKAERRFVGARKTALHLLEFGTAWLYLSRQSPRPPAWSQLRSLLWALRDLTESLDNELLFSGPLCDVRGLNERLVKLEQMVDKTQQKFTDEAK
ncbi:hypothetical protein GPALN_012941 [Globodera pallida]|nr:hypothetical protein GPALN_012941 [Globodera pallida]